MEQNFFDFRFLRGFVEVKILRIVQDIQLFFQIFCNFGQIFVNFAKMC